MEKTFTLVLRSQIATTANYISARDNKAKILDKRKIYQLQIFLASQHLLFGHSVLLVVPVGLEFDFYGAVRQSKSLLKYSVAETKRQATPLMTNTRCEKYSYAWRPTSKVVKKMR